MTKQAEDLIDRPFKNMKDDELMEFIRERRKSRSTLKATSKKAKSDKKTSVKKVDKLKDLLDGMSAEERTQFFKEAEDGQV